jgi:hypothetical protein
MTRPFPVPLFVCVAFATACSLLGLGCPKKAPPPPVEDAGAAQALPETPDVTVLQALTEDAGEDVAPEVGKKAWTGPATNPNQQKVQACCAAMRAQAKQLGASSPEGFQINAVAAQCDLIAKQVGPAGNAPEFNQLRAILKSVKLPAMCQF